MNMTCVDTHSTKAIIRKWYERLQFPKEYDAEFEKALNEIEISPETTVEDYDIKCEDGKKNLLAYLYMCERLYERYKERGIDDEVFLDTVGDIVRWTRIWTERKGELHLQQLRWLSNHLKMELHKIGSLEFIKGYTKRDFLDVGIREGEPYLDVHIPHGTPFTEESCRESFRAAREFYAKYYPEFEYNYFGCYSWLLDTTLRKLLREDSNIVKFQNMYEISADSAVESYAALKYVFEWDSRLEKKENLELLYGLTPKSSLAKNMKEYVLGGGKLYVMAGFIKAK